MQLGDNVSFQITWPVGRSKNERYEPHPQKRWARHFEVPSNVGLKPTMLRKLLVLYTIKTLSKRVPQTLRKI